MQAWTGRQALQLLLNYSIVPFCPQEKLLDHLDGFLSCRPYSRVTITELFDYILSDGFIGGLQNDDDLATRLLIRQMLDELQKTFFSLSNDVFEFEGDLVARMADAYSAACVLFMEKGIDPGPLRYYLVDKLPSPYDSRPFSALTSDEGDRVSFGIEPGVYFVRHRMAPVFSRMLLLHELIHVVISAKAPFDLARGLEEGICEFVGMFYFAPLVVGEQLARTTYISHRLNPPGNRMLDLYKDYMRQVYLFYLEFGWDGLFELIADGRLSIKTLESAFWANGIFNVLTRLQYKTGDFRFKNDTSHLLMMASQDLYCSPAAKLLSNFIVAGVSVQELCVQTGLGKETVLRALRELEDPVRYIGLRDDELVVTYSDCERLSSPLMLRAKL